MISRTQAVVVMRLKLTQVALARVCVSQAPGDRKQICWQGVNAAASLDTASFGAKLAVRLTRFMGHLRLHDDPLY